MEQQEYRMPAGTLLYAVYRLHRRGIYGLPNQMPSLSDKSFPLFAQEAFTRSFLSKNQTMNDVSDVLRRYAALMERAADEAETMDNALLQAVHNRLG